MNEEARKKFDREVKKGNWAFPIIALCAILTIVIEVVYKNFNATTLVLSGLIAGEALGIWSSYRHIKYLMDKK